MKTLEEYDTIDILEILSTNVETVSQLDKGTDIFIIICTCVFNTMTQCCINDISDKAKAMEEITEFSKKFEKTIEMLIKEHPENFAKEK